MVVPLLVVTTSSSLRFLSGIFKTSLVNVMAETGKIVVLCKGSIEKNETQETYINSLESAGYTCEYLRTLRFEFVNIPELRVYLSAADNYSGLILTSPRTVKAVALAIKEDTSILNRWKGLPAYCVGPATESLAQSLLDLQNCIGSQSGNSTKLAERIILDIRKDSKPLLYPCSEIARDTIGHILNNAVSIQKVTVYRTLESETLEQDLLGILKRCPISIFVFFSPSTVEHVAKQLKKTAYIVKDIKAVAIGPVTRDALINFGFNVYTVADKPEPISLTHAITTAGCGKNLKEADVHENITC